MFQRIISLVLFALLSACGLPDESIQQAKNLDGKTSEITAIIAKESDGFKKFIATPEGILLAKTIERESWQDTYFTTATAIVGKIQSRKIERIDPLLKRNNSDDTGKLNEAIAVTEADLRAVKRLLAGIQTRQAMLLALAKDSKAPLNQSAITTGEVSKRAGDFYTLSEVTKRNFPEKTTEIDKEAQKAKEFAQTAQDAYKKAQNELKSTPVDYGIVADMFAVIQEANNSSKDFVGKQENRFQELKKSYSKTLVDMRVDYFAQITRVSWDESSDWNTEKDYKFSAIPIDAETAQVLENPSWDESPIVTATYGYFASTKNKIGDAIWEKIKVDLWENRPASHDHAELYVDTSEKYFHKYRIEENGQITTTDWIEVNETTFDSAEDYLGMALISKAYGIFESESNKIPTPEGMEFVGNPAYGTWKDSPSGGGSIWHWYGQYAFIRDAMGGHTYSKNEWETWRREYRSKKPYHGPDDDEEERYGTGGTVISGSSSSYRNSSYVRTGSMDRWKSSNGSLSGTQRGSGPNFRGRGPGGSGK